MNRKEEYYKFVRQMQIFAITVTIVVLAIVGYCFMKEHYYAEIYKKSNRIKNYCTLKPRDISHGALISEPEPEPSEEQWVIITSPESESCFIELPTGDGCNGKWRFIPLECKWECWDILDEIL